jgi:hypothetical protein
MKYSATVINKKNYQNRSKIFRNDFQQKSFLKDNFKNNFYREPFLNDQWIFWQTIYK